jgi:hypothetical protein
VLVQDMAMLEVVLVVVMVVMEVKVRLNQLLVVPMTHSYIRPSLVTMVVTHCSPTVEV